MKRQTLLLALALGLLVPTQAASDEVLNLDIVQRRLDPEQPQLTEVGALTFKGALELSSADARFGGLSGLLVGDDGAEFTAISDAGHWISGKIVYDEAGNLTGLGSLRLGSMKAPDGSDLGGSKEKGDAEAIALREDGSIYVALERRPHRLHLYPPLSKGGLARLPHRVPVPRSLISAPENEGLEALTAWQGNAELIGITEGLKRGGGLLGYLRIEGKWEEFTYPLVDDFRPTAARRLPTGDLLVLERHFSVGRGLAIRLRRFAASEIAPGAAPRGEVVAELAPPMTVDNFEAMDVRRDAEGRTLVYLLSDDNFQGIQRTLMLLFALKE